jgi:hypothetical protein
MIHVAHTILTGAAVHLESLLVRVDVELDAGPCTRKRSNGSSLAPVVRSLTVNDVAVVVACAVCAAVAKEFGWGVVGTDLLRRWPEVVHRVLLVWKNGTVRDENAVNTNALAREGNVEGMVEGKRRLRVGETIQVPVGLS